MSADKIMTPFRRLHEQLKNPFRTEISVEDGKYEKIDKMIVLYKVPGLFFVTNISKGEVNITRCS